MGVARCLTANSLTILLVATFMSNSWSAPQGHFQRRNWTPQAMLYLKGAQGRRFISEDRKEGDMYDRIQLETRSQNPNPVGLSEAAAVLISYIRQAQEEDDDNVAMDFQGLPVWKRQFF
ncbi:spexin prohormone 1 [Polypterus senegalus]|uniref:spexin prohormone 1 n=1 Tax=Polypterus senegalus TaxID=55291 RepID=UPI001965BDBC|nr:spexin prohormone 1 [Polypterus senegalus]